jgi:cytosine/adenosine deaminase-related metal-dependent hydrolase
MTGPVVIDGAWVCADGAARVGAVLVEGRRIAAIAWSKDDRAALRSRADQEVDGTGHYLMPGLIDAHAHAYGTLLRGTENSLPLELWALHTTLYGRAFDGPAIRAAVLLGAAERIRAGITGVVDHSPAIHLAEDALLAHETSGLRVAFAPFLHDLSDYDLLGMPLSSALEPLVGGPPSVDRDAYAARFAEIGAAARGGSGRVTPQLGPNAPQRCSPAMWELWRTLRDRHGAAVHTHLLETKAQASLNARWDGGLVAEMARAGMLEGRLTCAHGVWLEPREMEVLARHDVTLSHNPASNLMLGSGVMPFQAATASGLRLALGCDSANTGGRHDLFSVMRLAMTLPRAAGSDFDAWPRATVVLSAATEGGGAALGWHGLTGRVEVGLHADLVLVRGASAGMAAAAPSIDALVQYGGPEHVDSVMVDGNWVMRTGEILTFDEAAVIADATNQAAALRGRVAAQLPKLLEEMPTMANRFRNMHV